MKKIFYFLALSISTFFSSQAQELDKALLWKISGNGLEKPSYLYGTIHITCDASLDNNVKKALDETSQLALEIDMDDPNMQTAMFGGINMKDGKTIKEMVSEEDYKLLNTLVTKNIGAPIDAFNTMKPFFITASMYPKMIDCANFQSFEQALMQVTKAQGEEVVGLETIQDQLDVFDTIPYEEQVKDLLRSAKDDLANDKKLLKEMLALYADKDIVGLEKLMNSDQEASTAKYKDIMLDNRNKNWISKIESLSKKQPTFFGVGAGHLPGKNGVITLLRDKGYTVTAVK